MSWTDNDRRNHLAAIRRAARRWLQGKSIIWIKTIEDYLKAVEEDGMAGCGIDEHGLEITISLAPDKPYRFHSDFSGA